MRALTPFEPALAQLRSAAPRPHARFPVHWERAFAAPLPHLTVFLQITEILSLRAEAQLALGDGETAAADVALGFRCCQALEHEPTLIVALVRWSMITRLESVVRSGLAKRVWQEPQLQMFQRDSRSLKPLANYRLAMSSERGFMNQSFDRFAGGATAETYWLLHARPVDEGSVTWAERVAAGIYPRGWFLQNKVMVNTLWDRLDEQVDSEARQLQSIEPMEHEGIAFSRSAFTRFYYAPTILSLPVLMHTGLKAAQAQVLANEAEIACALARVEAASGSLPEKLEELMPVFLAEIPIDPMSGAPLHYQKLGPAEYKIWSVGANQKDDGAKILPGKAASEQPDWVWHVRR